MHRDSLLLDAPLLQRLFIYTRHGTRRSIFTRYSRALRVLRRYRKAMSYYTIFYTV